MKELILNDDLLIVHSLHTIQMDFSNETTSKGLFMNNETHKVFFRCFGEKIEISIPSFAYSVLRVFKEKKKSEVAITEIVNQIAIDSIGKNEKIAIEMKVIQQIEQAIKAGFIIEYQNQNNKKYF